MVDKSTSACAATPELPRESAPTEVRFSIRAMLIVMAVVAVALASLSAFIRQFPPEARLRLAIYWGLLIVALLMLFAYHVWRRMCAEQQAGQTLVRLSRYSRLLPNSPVASATIRGVLALAAAPVLWIGGSYVLADQSGSWLNFANFGTLTCLYISGAGLTYFWWQLVQICDNGIIYRNQFAPWGTCRRWYCEERRTSALVIEISGHGQLIAVVPRDQNEIIKSILNQKMPGKLYD